ncbi:MAG: RraA family protein [Armatimonadota bacterium]|nr:RraA family protein [Armatimonadota bacterium]
MTINPRVNTLSRELVEAFLTVDPATIGHFIHFGFLDYHIKPLWRPVKIAGPAFTVRTPAMDTTMLHRCYEMLEPGDVLVIDRCGDRAHAGFGGVTAYAAKVRQVAGVVIDGLATDIREIEEYRLPVFAVGLTARTTKMYGTGGDINVPVTVGGVVVRPGDLVVGDDNGVLVLPPEEAPSLLKMAQEAEAREKETKEKLARGIPLTDISGSKRLIAADVPRLLRGIRFPGA